LYQASNYVAPVQRAATQLAKGKVRSDSCLALDPTARHWRTADRLHLPKAVAVTGAPT
jgi:hypothetical protein